VSSLDSSHPWDYVVYACKITMNFLGFLYVYVTLFCVMHIYTCEYLCQDYFTCSIWYLATCHALGWLYWGFWVKNSILQVLDCQYSQLRAGSSQLRAEWPNWRFTRLLARHCELKLATASWSSPLRVVTRHCEWNSAQCIVSLVSPQSSYSGPVCLYAFFFNDNPSIHDFNTWTFINVSW
jgi:hypothetical protein